nr:MAG TPA: hypothetical protein [Caudoviricetes sp.]
MITFKEIEERIERGDTPEIIREFLEEAARSGKMFDGELVRFICNGFDGEDYGENIDYFYQDFDDSSRWSIICTKIVRFNSDQYYSFWSEVGLTEMQENEWYDQKPLIARQKKIEKLIWVEEKIENESNF